MNVPSSPVRDDTPRYEKLLITSEEACQRLSISPSMLLKLVNRGEVPRVNIGRAVRFRASDIAAYAAMLDAAPR